MKELKFRRELYSKTALLKAAYNFTDKAYIHLDADEMYYYVGVSLKKKELCLTEQDFVNEMLAQSVRHEIYKETKSIRELLLARAMATSVLVNDNKESASLDYFHEDEILKDWFAEND